MAADSEQLSVPKHMRTLEIGVTRRGRKNNLWQQWFVFAGLGILVGNFFFVFFLEFFTNDGLNPHQFHSARWAPIGAEHWLGTDQDGRDVFALLALGAYTSFLMSLVSTCVFFIFGASLGILFGPDRSPRPRQ